jgi:flagellar basal-body rod protein FlgG
MTGGLTVTGRAMVNFATRHDVIAHNLANVSTPAFAREDTFLERLETAAEDRVSAPAIRTRTDFTPGPPVLTGNPLDLSLEGSGFFTVSTPDGPRFTRDGSLAVDRDGFLRTRDGEFILGENGILHVGDKAVTVHKDGAVYADETMIDRLKLVTFASGDQLKRETGGLYAALPGVKPETTLLRPTVHVGQLEGSAVQPVTELVRLIEAMRSYEAASRAVRATDRTLDRAVNDIARI